MPKYISINLTLIPDANHIKLEMKGNFLNLKDIFPDIHSRILGIFSLKWVKRKGSLLLQLLFSIGLDILTNEIRQEKNEE